MQTPGCKRTNARRASRNCKHAARGCTPCVRSRRGGCVPSQKDPRAAFCFGKGPRSGRKRTQADAKGPAGHFAFRKRTRGSLSVSAKDPGQDASGPGSRYYLDPGQEGVRTRARPRTQLSQAGNGNGPPGPFPFRITAPRSGARTLRNGKGPRGPFPFRLTAQGSAIAPHDSLQG
jgi:hypothetical protein